MEANIRLSQGLGKTLLVWSMVSFVLGVFLFFSPFELAAGIGIQSILWAVIDGLIASYTLFKQNKESRDKLMKILQVNTVLDIVYQIIGVMLIVFLWGNAFLMGNGIGIMIQGAFLFILDLYYLRQFKLRSIDETESR